ncbi:hypothetical protein SUGI_0887080 [Cryptomeria japonica]|nr:hypothetical protein SUGI_0887080 [Cryptomeria japonica]
MASTSSLGRREQERDPFLVLEPPCNNKVKSSLSAKQFDVFINHRGPDVKATLAGQLYDSLQQAGIRAYLDSEETDLGDFFPSAIKNAIFSAAVHIAILSPRYAESWKECLQNISGIRGYELNGQNDDLNKLCNGVVSAVMKEKHKRKVPLQVAKYEVGLDELVKDFHSHCQRNGQMRDKIIGIFGMGGSGKTTLVKDLFNRKHSEFSGSTVLFQVREKNEKGELTSLQSKLLSDLFCKNHHKFSSIEEGTTYIKHYLQRSRESKFLVVIDDLDHKTQLDALLLVDALNSNSLVIVTTRDERLLMQAAEESLIR